MGLGSLQPLAKRKVIATESPMVIQSLDFSKQENICLIGPWENARPKPVPGKAEVESAYAGEVR